MFFIFFIYLISILIKNNIIPFNIYIMSIITGKTSIVFNEPNKLVGLPPYYYRYRDCDTNLNGNSPADQYQKLKLIQNTVRVQGSLYTANLGPLTAYKKPISNPLIGFYGVCWNQMSDRPVPSVQRATVPTGYNTSMNRRHTSVTSSKPGSQTPGGKGCDIKHNSYDRYLNRLKGKGPLRRGVIPPTFGAPIPFNPAFPIYGGKTVKTNIVSGCDCPIGTPAQNFNQDERVYNDPNWQPDPSGNYYVYGIGSVVYAQPSGKTFLSKGTITSLNTTGNPYNVTFADPTLTQKTGGYTSNELIPYFNCDCSSEVKLYGTSVSSLVQDRYSLSCYLPDSLFLGSAVL
jgi:hypothetical protein